MGVAMASSPQARRAATKSTPRRVSISSDSNDSQMVTRWALLYIKGPSSSSLDRRLPANLSSGNPPKALQTRRNPRPLSLKSARQRQTEIEDKNLNMRIIKNQLEIFLKDLCE